MKIGNNLDLTKHELQNAVIQNLAAAPSNPKEGQVYYHTGDNTTYIWNGSSWEDALNQGTGGVSDHGALNGLADDEIHTHLNMTKAELEVILQKIKIETVEILREDKVAGL